jgi:hypothetical protein
MAVVGRTFARAPSIHFVRNAADIERSSAMPCRNSTLVTRRARARAVAKSRMVSNGSMPITERASFACSKAFLPVPDAMSKTRAPVKSMSSWTFLAASRVERAKRS